MQRPAYTVPILYQDLTQADALFHVLDALKGLENVASDIFTRLEDRVRARGRAAPSFRGDTGHSLPLL